MVFLFTCAAWSACTFTVTHHVRTTVVLQDTHSFASAVIPKPSDSDKEGLVIGWPTKPADMGKPSPLWLLFARPDNHAATEELKKLHEEIKSKM